MIDDQDRCRWVNGTGSHGYSRIKDHETVVVVVLLYCYVIYIIVSE